MSAPAGAGHTPGIPVYSAQTGVWTAPEMLPDGEGGFVVARVDWQAPPGSQATAVPGFFASGGQDWGFGAWTMGGERSGADWLSRLIVQRVDEQGRERWTTAGIVLSTVSGLVESPTLVRAGGAGFYVVWAQPDADYNVYAQRIVLDGTTAWVRPGKGVGALVREQRVPRAAEDGKDGVWVAWQDSRRGDVDVVVQHVAADGKESWPLGGATLTGPRDQFLASCVSDGKGGVWLTWYESRLGGGTDTFSAHLGADGKAKTGTPYWWRGF